MPFAPGVCKTTCIGIGNVTGGGGAARAEAELGRWPPELEADEPDTPKGLAVRRRRKRGTLAAPDAGGSAAGLPAVAALATAPVGEPAVAGALGGIGGCAT
jgi:hypothetical protein